uniref:Uncharacterized protein n=1 Tax=Anopheles culicifacies TaxID=139723 RepID=A0A182LZZ5_9DIPT
MGLVCFVSFAACPGTNMHDRCKGNALTNAVILNYSNCIYYVELDYGTIMCWADNVVGQQKEPCVFHLIAAGKPEMPYNCSLVNQTSESLEVDCAEGNYFTIICLSHQFQLITHRTIRIIKPAFCNHGSNAVENGFSDCRQSLEGEGGVGGGIFLELQSNKRNLLSS